MDSPPPPSLPSSLGISHILTGGKSNYLGSICCAGETVERVVCATWESWNRKMSVTPLPDCQAGLTLPYCSLPHILVICPALSQSCYSHVLVFFFYVEESVFNHCSSSRKKNSTVCSGESIPHMHIKKEEILEVSVSLGYTKMDRM